MTKENLIKRGLKLLGWFIAINLIFMIYFNLKGQGHTYNAVSFIQLLITIFLMLKILKEEKDGLPT